MGIEAKGTWRHEPRRSVSNISILKVLVALANANKKR